MSSDAGDGAPLVVEFVGTPGAGKTTLARAAIRLLQEEGVAAGTVVDLARPHAGHTLPGRVITRLAPRVLHGALLWQVFYLFGLMHAFRFGREHGGLARDVLRSQRARPIPAALKRHILFWFFQLGGRVRFLTSAGRGGEALVLDDGFLHRAVHLHASHEEAPEGGRVAAYVDALPAPGLVVAVIADLPVCERRVRQRGVWAHSAHLTSAQLARYLRHAEEVARLAVERARARGWTVVEIDNRGDLDQATRDLARALSPLRLSRAGIRRQPPAPGRGRVLRLPRPSRITGSVAARFGEPVIEPAAVGEVLARYGLRPLAAPRNLRLGRRNRNMVVATDAGPKVVKVYRPQWTADTVRYGHSILAYLEAQGFPAPRLLRTREGATTWTERDGEIFAVFDFLAGTNYSITYLLRQDRLRLTATAGSTLARLHRCLEGFQPEGAHHLGFRTRTGPRRRPVDWHAATLTDLGRRSEQLADPQARALSRRLVETTPQLLEALVDLERRLANAGFPRVVIHGDYGIHNLLYQADGTATPVDFELSRLDWRINDLISALGKHRYTGGVYDLESMETLLGAYAARLPLTADEVDLLPDAWRLYKLQAAVQYWNSYFETAGPVRKLFSALDSIAQAAWVLEHPGMIRRLSHTAGAGAR
jgi:homoserine kinase type II